MADGRLNANKETFPGFRVYALAEEHAHTHTRAHTHIHTALEAGSPLSDHKELVPGTRSSQL